MNLLIDKDIANITNIRLCNYILLVQTAGDTAWVAGN